MQEEIDPIDRIKHLLESKSTAKQVTYRNLQGCFQLLAKESMRIVLDLKKKVNPEDQDVTLDFQVINEHEFLVKLAGDLLIFVMHTNVVTLEANHPVMQDAYIREKEVNRYFGQIMVYNFMADSIRFNRVNDPGYLLARLLINHEARYVIEGDGPLASISNKISAEPISEMELNVIVKLALTLAIENDLMAPPFPDVRFITLHQKMEKTQELGAGQKIGFKMSYQDSLKG